jgi:hypothetical protein
MNTQQKRTVLFLFGCIGLRSFLVYIAYKFPQALPYMSLPALFIALGFTIIYLGGYRKTGAEVFGDRIWWNSLRPVHALLWASFAYFAFTKRADIAWKILLVDVIIGFLAFTINKLSVSK